MAPPILHQPRRKMERAATVIEGKQGGEETGRGRHDEGGTGVQQ